MQFLNILTALDSMPLNFFWKDRNGIILGCNLTQARWYGKNSVDEVIGKTDKELMGDSEFTQSWMSNDQEVMRSGTPVLFEETGITDGIKKIHLSYKSPIKDFSGNITGLVGISVDITQQKIIEKTLTEKKNNAEVALDNIIANLPGHVYWMDKENKFLGCNDLQSKHAGLSHRNEIVGKTNHQMPWADSAEALNNINNNVMKTNKEYVVEEYGPLIDGENRFFLSRKTPLLNDKGEVVGVLGISFDITDRKIMEQKLLEAKEAAEAASRAKTEFLANMSHDVKSPLVGIVSAAEVIAYDANAPEKDRQYASIISASGTQIANFFTSCLELSKMEMQEWATKTETLSLKKLLDDIHAMFAPQAMSKGLSLNIECDGNLPSAVVGHRDSLYRVLLNLTGNALKFTEKGGVTLKALSGESIDSQRLNVVFQVQDTGMGIPEDKHKIIFEKLQRLTPAYSNKIEGSGIGLYIVDQYVTRMNGTIRVESEVGKGSTFIVTIPLKISHKAVKPSSMDLNTLMPAYHKKPSLPTQTDEVIPNEKSSRINKKSILLVEDTDIVRIVTSTLFKDAGFEVDTAVSGEEAVAMFEPGKYGLIYMDIGLPQMDGYETAAAIREKEKNLNASAPTPIIALTGHGAIEIQQFCSQAGIQAILSKPVSREQANAAWAYYAEKRAITVPGLTTLDELLGRDILDRDITEERVGSKQIADNLLAQFIKHLEQEFLPTFKTAIEDASREKVRFLLHQQLGAVAYVEAPKLKKTLLSIQQAVKSDEPLTLAMFQSIERASTEVIAYYYSTTLSTGNS